MRRLLLFLLAIPFVVGAPAGFSDPVSFQIIDRVVTASDDAIYYQGWYSANNNDWVPFLFPDAQTSGWILDGEATKQLPDVFSAGGEHYVLVYSCSKGNAWSCHGGRWQIVQYIVPVCTPQSDEITCAGKCGSQLNNCGSDVSCPACSTGSDIVIYAAGNEGSGAYPTMELLIDGVVVQSWIVDGDQVWEGVYEEYSYTHTGVIDASNVVRVNFPNDDIGSRDLRVDRIVIDGVSYESEVAGVLNTGFYDGVACGNTVYPQSEFLHCTGYLEFDIDGSGPPLVCDNNGLCDSGETNANCPNDCPECQSDDECSDGDACTTDTCSDGRCEHTAIPNCGEPDNDPDYTPGTGGTGGFTCDSPEKIVDFETGDESQVPPGDIIGTKAIVTDIVHSGNYAVRFIEDGGKSDIRMWGDDTTTLGTNDRPERWESFWVYLEPGYSGSSWNLLFEWCSDVNTGTWRYCDRHISVHFEDRSGVENNVYLYFGHNFDYGMFQDDPSDSVRRSFYSGKSLPEGQWVHFLLYSYWSLDHDKGKIRVWMDGDEVASFNGRTMMSEHVNNGPRIEIGAYRGPTSNPKALYIDDFLLCDNEIVPA